MFNQSPQFTSRAQLTQSLHPYQRGRKVEGRENQEKKEGKEGKEGRDKEGRNEGKEEGRMRGRKRCLLTCMFQESLSRDITSSTSNITVELFIIL